MMNTQRPIVTAALAALAFSAGTASRDARAAEVIIPTVPLIVSIDAVPNVYFQVDNSGSMDFEVLAGEHYPSCRYNPVMQCSDTTPPDQGRMQLWTGRWSNGNNEPFSSTFSYIFELNSSVYTAGDQCDESNQDTDRRGAQNNGNPGATAACIDEYGDTNRSRNQDSLTRTYDLDRDWRIHSSAMNVQYFDPTIEYTPWIAPTSTFPNSTFTGARAWPIAGESGYSTVVNLDNAFGGGSAVPFRYHVWDDNRGYSGAAPSADPVNMTLVGNGEVDQWDSHYTVEVSSTAVSCSRVDYDPKNFSWPDEIRGINPTVTPLLRNSAECLSATNNLSDAQLRQRVANWFTYYRSRSHLARGAIGNVVTQLPNFRYGVEFINSNGKVTHYIPDSEITDYAANTAAMVSALHSTNRISAGTPLRRGLERIGEIFADDVSSVPSPIILSCQKNFALLFTDGFWNGGDPGTPSNDVDGDGQTISGENVTLADVAAYFYRNDLRTDLDDAVPTDAFDSANWQHMVTYTVAFGVKGGLVDGNGDGWPDPPLGDADDWYTSGNSNSDKVDDLWHAAWNSRGKYFNAARPQELFESLSDALSDIGARIGGAASAAANSGSISSTSRIFQAKFDSQDWHGELAAFPVNDDGTLGSAAVWEANALLNAKTNAERLARRVFTWNNDGSFPQGTPFAWASISTDQANLLNTDSVGNPDSLGQARLRYILGEDINEQANGGSFRDRTNYLGDIVNSDPVFVGFPPFFYPFDNYQQYFSDNLSREGVIYVGANDGMLHAFKEATGEELFAYVPDAVVENLPKLTDPGYAHTFFVDGPPGYGDVFIGGAWKSIISGGLRSGGQAVYALDVTTPLTFDQTNVLWEFSDEDDADLGYVWGEPQIKRMANGKWAVIVGNGLNNTEADGNESTTGAGALFILYIQEGRNGWTVGDYVKLTVPGGSVTTPNGLFTPAAADINGDSKVDFIYAGDRLGRMWKFDVRDADDANWELDFSGAPFFDAGVAHPITDRPAIAPHPQGRSLGQLVLFGTGKYIETTDNDTVGQPVQTMYALWDFDKGYQSAKGLSDGQVSGYSRTELNANTFSMIDNVRVIEGGTRVDWLDGSNNPNKKGWYIDLPQQGERMVRRPVLRDNLVFFVTMTPDPDPCAAGGTGFISVLDISTGIAPTFPVFDIDGDLDVSVTGDTKEGSGGDPGDDSDNLIPVGISSPSIPNLPALIYDDRPGFSATTTQFPMEFNAARGCESGSARAYTFTTGSNGSILAIETATEALSCGRQNWRGER